MKKNIEFALIITFLGASAAFGQVRYDAKTWRSVQTIDVQTLSKSMSGRIRQLVAVKFNFRGKDIHHLKPNWYESSIWQTDPEKQGKFVDIRVMVAKKDLNAFKSIPTAGSPSAELVLYGRVERD